jgi:hypothetical protein
MTPYRRCLWVGVLIPAALLSGCGGGGGADSTTTSVPVATSLAKYQGKWVQQCAEPIPVAGGGFSAGSVRETLDISAPDGNGKVSIQSTEEFFGSVLACYDETTPAYANVKNVLPAEAVFARQQLLQANAGNATYDVVKITQRESDVTAVGAGITSVDVAGVATWRITFQDGSSTDREKRFAALSGELALLTSDLIANGQLIAELRTYGGQQPYRKRKP